MKLIDGHMHTRHSPKNWFIDCADARGYSAYALLSLSCMRAYGGAANNEQCLEVKRADPTRAYFFCGLVHPCPDPLAHVKRWLDRGADGLKLIETKPTVFNETQADLSAPEYDEMFAYLEETGTPILWHVGDPATFWKREEAPDFAFENGWFYGDGGFPTLAQLYAIPERVLSRHPKLRVCFAHLYFCGDDRAHLERILTAYPNVRVDITPGVEMYDHFFADRETWRRFFLTYQDRIQLGTDTDMGDEYLGKTPLTLALGALGGGEVNLWGHHGRGLDLPKDVQEKIAYHNFRAFAGPSPRPL
jgi:predicted TIM-barrel fold metal-dependent hydrolase